ERKVTGKCSSFPRTSRTPTNAEESIVRHSQSAPKSRRGEEEGTDLWATARVHLVHS
uniref:Uncharacterized protein n=1 Tax=Aegilops tauschii subsp. strangulata TaxID=200361 RepID=A0A452YHY6_AEGTS